MKPYEKYKREVLKNIFVRFLQNATNEKEKNYIINIIKNISWYWDYIIYEYFINEFVEEFDEKSILINHIGDRDSSSAKKLYAYLANGIITDNDILKVEELNKITDKVKKIFVIDDFIGSGSSIIKAIKKIENHRISNVDIYVKCYVCCATGEENIKRFESKNNNKIFLKYERLEKSYLNKGLDSELIQYINSICSRCYDVDYAFGYRQCGTMISINGVSPNNNLSLLYRDDIENWNKLLDRDINLLVLNKKRSEIIKENVKEISTFYYSEKLNNLVTLKEFQLLILLYNCFGMDTELLKKYNFFATIKEYEGVLAKLKEKGILNNDFFVEINDKNILQILKKFEKYIELKFIKKKNIKFY